MISLAVNKSPLYKLSFTYMRFLNHLIVKVCPLSIFTQLLAQELTILILQINFTALKCERQHIIAVCIPYLLLDLVFINLCQFELNFKTCSISIFNISWCTETFEFSCNHNSHFCAKSFCFLHRMSGYNNGTFLFH